MSIFIKDGIPHIRRGDSGDLTVPITVQEDDGSPKVPYELQDGDELTLTIRERAESESPVLLQLHSITGTFIFDPADTTSIPAGKYSFDVQLTMADGSVHTLIPKTGDKHYEKETNWKNFCIEAEVTR